MFYNSGRNPVICLGDAINNKRVFSIISEVNEALALTNEPEPLVNAALDTLMQVLDVECCWIQTAGNGKDKALHLAGERGFSDAMRAEVTAIGLDHSFADRVMGTGDKIIIPDLNHDGLYGLNSFRYSGYRWLVAAPLMTYRVYGVLGAASKRRRRPPRETAELVMIIAKMVAGALGKAYLTRTQPLAVSPATKPASSSRASVLPEPLAALRKTVPIITAVKESAPAAPKAVTPPPAKEPVPAVPKAAAATVAKEPAPAPVKAVAAPPVKEPVPAAPPAANLEPIESELLRLADKIAALPAALKKEAVPAAPAKSPTEPPSKAAQVNPAAPPPQTPAASPPPVNKAPPPAPPPAPEPPKAAETAFHAHKRQMRSFRQSHRRA